MQEGELPEKLGIVRVPLQSSLRCRRREVQPLHLCVRQACHPRPVDPLRGNRCLLLECRRRQVRPVRLERIDAALIGGRGPISLRRHHCLERRLGLL